jgi:hypothetical protein
MIPAKVPIIVSAGYDPNDETMRLCRENWRQYMSGYPDIRFVCNRVDTSMPVGTYGFSAGDLRIGMEEIIGRGNSERDYTEWAAREWSISHIRNLLLFRFILERVQQPFWFVHTNITGFVCLDRLSMLLNHLPCERVYAGLPIYFEPEDFIYIAGSHVIWSSDYFSLMVENLQKVSFEASDITWGRAFRNLGKTLFPIGNFLHNEHPDDPALSNKLKLANNLVKAGHFLFRFKNYYPGIPREHIDPYLQSFIMAACKEIKPNVDRTFALVNDFTNRMRRGEGMAAITAGRESA